MALQLTMTRHALERSQQRGISEHLIAVVLDHHDIEIPAGSGAMLYRVSKALAQGINLDDRLGRCAVLIAGDGVVITVGHIFSNKRGKRWARRKG